MGYGIEWAKHLEETIELVNATLADISGDEAGSGDEGMQSDVEAAAAGAADIEAHKASGSPS